MEGKQGHWIQSIIHAMGPSACEQLEARAGPGHWTRTAGQNCSGNTRSRNADGKQSLQQGLKRERLASSWRHGPTNHQDKTKAVGGSQYGLLLLYVSVCLLLKRPSQQRKTTCVQQMQPKYNRSKLLHVGCWALSDVVRVRKQTGLSSLWIPMRNREGDRIVRRPSTSQSRPRGGRDDRERGICGATVNRSAVTLTHTHTQKKMVVSTDCNWTEKGAIRSSVSSFLDMVAGRELSVFNNACFFLFCSSTLYFKDTLSAPGYTRLLLFKIYIIIIYFYCNMV
jgi:hypothetical protein